MSQARTSDRRPARARLLPTRWPSYRRSPEGRIHRNRRALAQFGVGLLTAVSLAACGAGSTQAPQSPSGSAATGTAGSIDVLVESGGHLALQQISQNFTKETGIGVNLVELPYDGLFDRLSTEFSSGAPSFDVGALDAVWLPTFAKSVLPLDDLFTDQVKADLFPSLLTEANVGGHFVGMPLWTNSEILFYRTDLFSDPEEQAAFQQKYGYPLAPPTTWQQFYDAAEFFTRDTDGDGTPDLYGTDVIGAQETEWLAHALQAGAEGTALAPDGTPIVNDQAHLDALDFYTSLLPFAPPGAEQIDWGGAQNLFNQGKTAMLRWWAHAYYQVPTDSPVYGKVGAAPMIGGSAGIAGVPGAWYLSIPTGSPHEALARQYVQYIYDNNALAIESAKEGGLGLAARISAFQSYSGKPGYENLEPLLETLSAPATKPRPATPQWQQVVDSVLIPVVQKAIDTNGTQNQAILDDAEKQLQAMDIQMPGQG